jgi:hypothetical protein
MPWSLQSHLDRFAPRDRRLLLKSSALYAERFKQRVFSASRHETSTTGEEILALTLGKIAKGCDGYVFRDGDILLFYYLCRCCRTTVLALHNEGRSSKHSEPAPLEEEDDAPLVLTERAAVQFLERRQGLDQFLTFIATQKLRGKLRPYASGFHRYAVENWDEQQIAKSLGVDPSRVAKYRSRLRELIEDFELARMRAAPNLT